MDDYELAIKSCKQLEHLLVQVFGANGRGLHEKVTSIESKLPHPLLKKLRFIATVRNQLVHEVHRDRLNDRSGFQRACIEAEQQLNSLPTPGLPSPSRPCGKQSGEQQLSSFPTPGLLNTFDLKRQVAAGHSRRLVILPVLFRLAVLATALVIIGQISRQLLAIPPSDPSWHISVNPIE